MSDQWPMRFIVGPATIEAHHQDCRLERFRSHMATNGLFFSPEWISNWCSCPSRPPLSDLTDWGWFDPEAA